MFSFMNVFVYSRHRLSVRCTADKDFLPFCRLPFHSITGIQWEVPLVNCWPYFLGDWSLIQEILTCACVLKCLIFSTVSSSIFRVLIHLEFVKGEGRGPCDILLPMAIQFSQHHLLKRLSFYPVCIFRFFVKTPVAAM